MFMYMVVFEYVCISSAVIASSFITLLCEIIISRVIRGILFSHY